MTILARASRVCMWIAAAAFVLLVSIYAATAAHSVIVLPLLLRW